MKHYDALLHAIAEYTFHYDGFSDLAFETANYCLADALGCALLALTYPACYQLLGPIIEGTIVPNGCRIPGTSFVLNPIEAAFNLGTMIRWLDYNDTWLAAEWGHPSDNLGGILAIGDFLCQNGKNIRVIDLFKALIQAYEIQGILALNNSFNQVGLDHVILVKIATAAVTTKLLGGNINQILDAVSQAFVDGGPLRLYRHYPNTGSRKSWAAGDQTSRGLMFAWLTMKGEKGYRTPLTVPKWGFHDVFFKGKELSIKKDFGCYVIENILFKVSFPAEFHAQTAVEAAIQLHSQIKNKIEDIELINIETHESALKIIDKKGTLQNPADRDHCLQYMVAIALLYGDLNANHYEEFTAQNPQIDQLRNKMVLTENIYYSKDYLDEDKRSISNAIEITFKDGSKSEKIEVEYPLGHKKRRREALSFLFNKFQKNCSPVLGTEKSLQLTKLFSDINLISNYSVSDLLNLFLL